MKIKDKIKKELPFLEITIKLIHVNMMIYQLLWHFNFITVFYNNIDHFIYFKEF